MNCLNYLRSRLMCEKVLIGIGLAVASQNSMAANPPPSGLFYSDVVQKTMNLAELLRRNVETVEIDEGQINTDDISSLALVPFTLTGVDGGNVTQEYVALYAPNKAGPTTIYEGSGSVATIPVSVLISFTKIDRRIWGAIEWKNAKMSDGVLHAVSHAFGCMKYRCCTDELGSITIRYNEGIFENNLEVENHVNPSYSLERCSLEK